MVLGEGVPRKRRVAITNGPGLHHDVVAAAIVHNDKVLLCHRHPTRTWYPNVWDLPGGHVEVGEQRLDALARELREELTIEIDLTRVVSVLRHSPEPALDIEVWAVLSWRGEIINAEPAEHDKIGWFKRVELDDLLLADPGVMIACIRALEVAAGDPPRPA
jgi:8-oxo-dGTP diphosphatase